MGNKNIQIKYKNETGVWEGLDPKTNAGVVQTSSGKSVETVLTEKQDKATSYNKTDLYTKTEVDAKISAFKQFDIPVSSTEPSGDESFWFELI